ncbi:BLUF domain-containing protein [Caulobacter sp. KR2-114]|uniref:BLUF domain-containing protein n=1 Tax=Caulobacter sp. KR2-114 TaxID=3400912 RepID=UPI003C067C03
MLVRCLYASRATVPGDARAVAEIVAISRRRNAEKGVTGLLCVAGDVFIQVLEGGRDEVNDLYNRIVGDRRHAGVRLLSYREIRTRKFSLWSMGKVDTASLNAALLLKYFKSATLDPFEGSGEATLALLLELVETGSVAQRD